MREAFRVLAAATALTATCAAAPTAMAGTIVGGRPATQGYDYAAALRVTFPGLGEGRCAGALVSARFVVTAAHCLRTEEGIRPSRIRVAVGNVNYDTALYTDAPLDGYRLHPEFTGRAGDGFDVGVIRLPAAVPNAQLRLLRPGDAPLWAPGTRATVVGWGMTDDGHRPSSTLREVEVPIFSDAECAEDFRSAGAPPGFFSAETMLCAGGRDGRDACGGDSGGPLVVFDGAGTALAGMVSFGAASGDGESCAEGLPGIYSRVGADPLNSFVRSVVPQVEIDWAPARPAPGRPVTFSASPSPAGGPAHDGFAWDLDGDGSFDDAQGPSATTQLGQGSHVVGVRAARGNEAEVRRILVAVQRRSPVSFSHGAVTVREGDTATVRVVKQGDGAGEVSLAERAGTAAPGTDTRGLPTPVVAFGAREHARELAVATVDDDVPEPAETFTVELTDARGDLVPGDPARITVTVVDDDGKARVTSPARGAKVRAGRFWLPYATTAPGRVVVRVQDAGGRTTHARSSRRHRSAGRFLARLRLDRAARAALARRGRLHVRVTLAMFGGGDLVSTERRRVRLRLRLRR